MFLTVKERNRQRGKVFYEKGSTPVHNVLFSGQTIVFSVRLS